MRKSALYSKSPNAPVNPAEAARAQPAAEPVPRMAWRVRIIGMRMGLLVACACIAAGVAVYAATRAAPRALTQQDIDAAVLHTLDTHVLPSMAHKAYAAVIASVVHVRGLRHVESGANADDGVPPRAPTLAPKSGKHPSAPADAGEDRYRIGVGTGVVIVDTGVILTNLHVIEGAESIVVTFADGLESPADVISTQPENDLAVLKARQIPDDLPAATLRSTADLSVGDQVVAIGFPFGIGPSASAGVVSGLKREFRSEKNHVLTNLIQFDAAANPGNSGGPLVTADGAVVGIVTGIYNPGDQRVFVGIGFAVPIENAASAVGLSPF
ncbi:MAG: trypsin-like peptidase domain-containing protein [Casimicrobiaceae bacterium]